MFTRVVAYKERNAGQDDDRAGEKLRSRKISTHSHKSASSRGTNYTTSTESSYRSEYQSYRRDDERRGRFGGSLLGLMKVRSKSDAKSISSCESNDSSNSGKGKKSKWQYSIENFEGPKNNDDQLKYLTHQSLWAQAYSFGGR